MVTTVVNQFNGGMTNEPHDSGLYCQLSKNLDTLSRKHTLTQWRSTEDAYSSQSTARLQNFVNYGGSVYGLGVVSGTGRAEIAFLSDISSTSWSSPTNGSDAGGTTSFELFVEYKGVLYGASAGSRIWAYDIGATTFTSTALNVTSYTNVAQGLVHSKDDILYIGYDNKIVKKDNAAGSTVTTGWTSPALTLPSNQIITSLCEYGNYLAIATRPTNGAQQSYVYLWDRDSSLATLSDKLDWGSTDLYQIENIDGYIIGVSVSSANLSLLSPKIVFSVYGGGGVELIREIEMDSSPTLAIKRKQKFNNKLYFGINGTTKSGTTYDATAVWSIGRKSPQQPFSVNIERVPNNDTLVAQILGFIGVGDYFITSYLTVGSVYGLSKTDNDSNYASTSYYRTTINPNMSDIDKVKKKQLMSVACLYNQLPTAGQVVLKYRVDGGSWVTIFTETTNSATFTEMSKTSSGVEFTSGREYEFEIQSYGGAEVTALVYKYKTLETLI